MLMGKCHIIFVFLWLTSLDMIISRPSMLLQMASFHPLWLSNISLYICITSLSIPVNGYLGCFHILAVGNSAAVNIGVHVSFWNIVFSVNMPRSGIVGSYDRSLFSVLKEPPSSSPKWLYQLTFPPMVYEGSLVSTPAPALIVCRIFDDGCSDQWEVKPLYSFALHFSNS